MPRNNIKKWLQAVSTVGALFLRIFKDCICTFATLFIMRDKLYYITDCVKIRLKLKIYLNDFGEPIGNSKLNPNTPNYHLTILLS